MVRSFADLCSSFRTFLLSITDKISIGGAIPDSSGCWYCHADTNVFVSDQALLLNVPAPNIPPSIFLVFAVLQSAISPISLVHSSVLAFCPSPHAHTRYQPLIENWYFLLHRLNNGCSPMSSWSRPVGRSSRKIPSVSLDDKSGRRYSLRLDRRIGHMHVMVRTHFRRFFCPARSTKPIKI